MLIFSETICQSSSYLSKLRRDPRAEREFMQVDRVKNWNEEERIEDLLNGILFGWFLFYLSGLANRHGWECARTSKHPQEK